MNPRDYPVRKLTEREQIFQDEYKAIQDWTAQLRGDKPVDRKNIIGRLFCSHNGDKNFVEGIYADQINLWNCRSFWQCTKCGAMLKSQSLHEFTT